jgi:hypothetical protein
MEKSGRDFSHPVPMLEKGSSRQTLRRRRHIVAIAIDDDESSLGHSSDEVPIRLEPPSTATIKEIARIESNTVLTPVYAADSELSWGQQSARRGPRTIWWPITFVIICMFTAIALVQQKSITVEGDKSAFDHNFVVISESLDEQAALMRFQKDFYQRQQQAIALLKKFAAAQTPTEALPLIRKTDQMEQRLENQWKPWPSPPVLDQEDLLESEIAQTSGRAFLWMRGKNQDSSNFLAFFVIENDVLLLDWEATTQWGEARLTSLAMQPTHQPLVMRVILSPSAYYLPTLPESEYVSYKLTHLNDEIIVWGFVKRDSPIHQEMNSLLGLDSELLEPVSEIRATLRMKKTDINSSKNHFFITELLHSDWVTP